MVHSSIFQPLMSVRQKDSQSFWKHSSGETPLKRDHPTNLSTRCRNKGKCSRHPWLWDLAQPNPCTYLRGLQTDSGPVARQSLSCCLSATVDEQCVRRDTPTLSKHIQRKVSASRAKPTTAEVRQKIRVLTSNH